MLKQQHLQHKKTENGLVVRFFALNVNVCLRRLIKMIKNVMTLKEFLKKWVIPEDENSISQFLMDLDMLDDDR